MQHDRCRHFLLGVLCIFSYFHSCQTDVPVSPYFHRDGLSLTGSEKLVTCTAPVQAADVPFSLWHLTGGVEAVLSAEYFTPGEKLWADLMQKNMCVSYSPCFFVSE